MLPGLDKADFGRFETNPALLSIIILSKNVKILPIPNASIISGGVGGW